MITTLQDLGLITPENAITLEGFTFEDSCPPFLRRGRRSIAGQARLRGARSVTVLNVRRALPSYTVFIYVYVAVLREWIESKSGHLPSTLASQQLRQRSERTVWSQMHQSGILMRRQ
jgi:hypothetical protein